MRLSETVDFKGQEKNFVYDDRGRLTSLINYEANGSTVMTSFVYSYDLDGYVTLVTREDGDGIAYGYDGVGRLTDEWRKDGANTVYRNQFQYDAVGNRTQWIATDSVSDSTTFSYTYNTLNQLTQRTWSKGGTSYLEKYWYDLNGNLIMKDEKADSVLQERWVYTWDSEDRLIQVVQKDGASTVLKTVEYAYCPACGGGVTHKIVSDGAGSILKWEQYETESGVRLRIDEKWDNDTPPNGIDAADPWRTRAIRYHFLEGIAKEILHTYPSNTSGAVLSSRAIFYHHDSDNRVVNLSASGGELIPGQEFGIDSANTVLGPLDLTCERASWYDSDSELITNGTDWFLANAGYAQSVAGSSPPHIGSPTGGGETRPAGSPFDIDPTPPDAARQEECCATQKSREKGKPPAGRLICCDGHKTPCSFLPTTGHPNFDKIAAQCVKEHEMTHADDTHGCLPPVLCDEGVQLPDWNTSDKDERNKAECDGHQAGIACLRAHLHECGTDTKCREAIRKLIEQTIAHNNARYNCRNYGKELK